MLFVYPDDVTRTKMFTPEERKMAMARMTAGQVTKSENAHEETITWAVARKTVLNPIVLLSSFFYICSKFPSLQIDSGARRRLISLIPNRQCHRTGSQYLRPHDLATQLPGTERGGDSAALGPAECVSFSSRRRGELR